MAILVIEQGMNEGATYRLGQRNLTIGRDPGNLVQVIDDKVSRRHAAVRWTGEHHEITDLRSHNGIELNGQRVSSSKIGVGDRLRLGNTVLKLIPDQRIEQDATLGRKVMDRGIVAGATQAARTAVPVQETIDSGRTVDIDDLKQSRDLERSMFYYELGGAARKETPQTLLDLAVAGIFRFVAPDRCIVFGTSPNGQAVTRAIKISGKLSQERRRVQPVMKAISSALQGNRSVLWNDLPARGDPRLALGSVAAVPVKREDGRAVGLVYLDSFADNLQAYVDEDLVLLEQAGTKLGSALLELAKRG